MNTNSIPGEVGVSNSGSWESGTTAEFHFADLPFELQKDLKKAGVCISVRPWTVRALGGDAGAALFLNQGMYWSVRAKDGPGGKFTFSKSRASEQLGLSRTAYDRACQRLVKLGVLSHTEDALHNRTFSLNWQRVLQLYEKDAAASALKERAVGTLGHRQGQHVSTLGYRRVSTLRIPS